MAPSTRRSGPTAHRAAGATTLAFTLAAFLTACAGPDGCGTGAASPTEAVEELLAAAAEDDRERACAVGPRADVEPDDVTSDVAEIAAFLADAGGPDAVTVREIPDSQMGSAQLVEVLAPDASARLELVVLHSGGRYAVDIGPDVPHDGEPTTDPGPPADDEGA